MSASTSPEHESGDPRHGHDHGHGDHDDDHDHGGHGHGDHDHDHDHGDHGHGHGHHGHGHHGHGHHGHDRPPHEDGDGCLPIPPLERVNYFYGQMLGVREFRSEQAYFREKLKLHNRYLHGSGVVCGLAVVPCPPPADPSCDPAPPRPCVVVECGLALDCCGNEIALRQPITVQLADLLTVEERRRLSAEGAWVWLSICFREQGIQPTRPLSVDDCRTSLPDCVHALVRDDLCVRASLERPHTHLACSACGASCCDGCLVLARVRVEPGAPVGEDAIDNTVRRPLAAFDTTRIDRIGWTHGAQYTRDEAAALLTRGLFFRFTRPVHARTVTAPGVFDLWAIEGGRGRRGLIYHIDTRAETEPHQEMVRWVRFLNLTDEVLQPGDRVLVTLRSSFVLDECCRSLDGDHAGGLLRIEEDYSAWDRSSEVAPQPCAQPPPRQLMPWMTGNGEPAGNFESWFTIEADHHHQGGGHQQQGPSRRSQP